MRIATFGATGRIGRHAVARALELGHQIVALSTSTAAADGDGRVDWVAGDARDVDAVRHTIDGTGAIVVALGPRANTAPAAEAIAAGMRTIVGVASELGVRRIVTLSGAGITVPGEQKPALDRLVSVAVRRLARHVVGAKQREYEILAASGLDWTALRPPLVVEGAAQGYRLSLALEVGARVRRVDVGAALIDVLADGDAWIRTAPFVLPPGR